MTYLEVNYYRYRYRYYSNFLIKNIHIPEEAYQNCREKKTYFRLYRLKNIKNALLTVRTRIIFSI